MLTVTDLSTSEPLINYKAFEVYEEVNGPLTLSFTSIDSKNNPGHKLLKGEALVETQEGRQFRIKQMGGSAYRKQINASSIFFDLKGTQKYDIFGGTKTLNEFLSWILEGTGWTFENVNVTGFRLIENFGKADALKLIEILLSEFQCERQILPGKHLRFEKQLGPDRDYQYRYGHNIKAININEDTTSYGTIIRGYGANGLTVTYRSPKADIIGEHHAEPFTDERFTVPENLIERIKKELRDEPEVAYELDAYELTEKELGERVWLIHEILGIEFNTRVLAKTTRIPKEKSSVVVGNTKPATATDQLAEQNVKIDQNAKQTNSKFDQTNDQFAFEVERLNGSISEAKMTFDLTADGIIADVAALRTYTDDELGQVKEEASANVSILAGQILAAVSTNKDYTDSLGLAVRQENSANFNLLSGRINAKAEASTVTALGTRLNSVEWDMNAVEGQISQKVSTTDFNGNTIVSKLNQTSTTFDIEARIINLRGAVNVLSDITGDLGNITSGNINITNNITVGNNIYMGSQTSTAVKSLYFFNTANITAFNYGAATEVHVNADTFRINGTRFDAPNLSYLNAPKLVTSAGVNPTKIELAYSPGSNTMYFDINGTRIGYVRLTPY